MGELSGQSETRSAILDVAHHYHDYERVRPVNDRGLLFHVRGAATRWAAPFGLLLI